MKETEPKVGEVKGLYLRLGLQEVAKDLGRPLVIANYVCDQNDVIAKKEGEFQVPHELKNAPDWRLFQELTAQTDVIITGAGYLQRFAKKEVKAQDVINQFSQNGEFADLGDWRVKHGMKRSPDMAVVSRSLNFEIPEAAFSENRKVYIFTTNEGAGSSKAKEYREAGAEVLAAGKVGVDGVFMIGELASRGYKVIKNTTGPRVLDILLSGNVLDAIFITRVHKVIKADPEDTQTVLLDKILDNLDGFKYKRLFYLEEVKTADGNMISEDFGVYNKTSNSIKF